MVKLITDHIDIWTSAQRQKTNGVGRGNASANQSPHGIKKLRELILELAVRGKLVPQDPKDEPASVLLEKIAKEKARLIKSVEIKKEKQLPEIGEDEKPFGLPLGWEWARVGEIAQHNSGKTLDSRRNTGSLREYITTSNLYWGYFILDNLRQMPISDDEVDKCTASQGDLLICEGGEAGRAAVWSYSHDICIQNHIHRVRFFCAIDPYYVYRIFQKMNYSGEIDSYRKGVGISNMSGKALSSILIPIPPIAEQQRIVAKVDELMALCDQLEQQQTDSNIVHQTLVETLLTTLTTAADQDEFAEAWKRIAEHFDTLFITEQSIDKLKQTILQLAVMGKLVPQDPSDEPASMLLEKIAEEKTRLIKEGKIKKQQPLPEITNDEKPFYLPEGWKWARLGDITNRIGSGSTPRGGRSIYVASGIPFLRSQNIWNHGLKLNDVVFITEGIHQQMSNTIVLPNDILLNITGASLGRCAIYPDGIAEANVSQHVTIIRTTDTSIRFYLHLCILSPYLQCLVWERQVGMAREGLSKKVLELFEIPLPPLAEQHRIVAKVDELIAICDALKARINDAQATQNQLADAIIEQAGKDGCNH